MIIGISGKKNSGKNLVGRIIQYLIYLNNNPSKLQLLNYKTDSELILDIFKGNASLGSSIFNYEIKKFADKVNEIYKILTGTNFLLLSREEKEKERQNFINLAENMKLVTNNLSIWADTLILDYVKYYNRLPSEYKEEKINYPNWIITDLRFPDELDTIKEREPNTITIRVNRDKEQLLKDKGIHIPKHLIKEHYSETALDDAKFDYVINNNGTIEELIEKVREILIKEKII